MAFNLPSPGLRAGTFSGACFVTLRPSRATRSPASPWPPQPRTRNHPRAGRRSRTDTSGLPGGLTTPAIWPEPAITWRTGPPKHLAPVKTERAGLAAGVRRALIGEFFFSIKLRHRGHRIPKERHYNLY